MEHLLFWEFFKNWDNFGTIGNYSMRKKFGPYKLCSLLVTHHPWQFSGSPKSKRQKVCQTGVTGQGIASDGKGESACRWETGDVATEELKAFQTGHRDEVGSILCCLLEGIPLQTSWSCCTASPGGFHRAGSNHVQLWLGRRAADDSKSPML